MKRVLLAAILCSLLAVPTHATEIFWEQGPPPDPVVKDSDFKHKYGGSPTTPSLEQKEIYDSGEVLKLDYEIKEESERLRTRLMGRSESTEDVQPITPVTTRPETRRGPSTITPAKREKTPRSLEPSVEPARRETPVARPPAKEETKTPAPVPASAPEPAKTEPKKMHWGEKEEPKTNSDSQTKSFQWGNKVQPSKPVE